MLAFLRHDSQKPVRICHPRVACKGGLHTGCIVSHALVCCLGMLRDTLIDALHVPAYVSGQNSCHVVAIETPLLRHLSEYSAVRFSMRNKTKRDMALSVGILCEFPR